jgi:HD-like signal output (HDOD) protein
MVTKEEIQNYLKNVPALPNVVRECLNHLQIGELDKAAIAAKKDQKLIHYLKTVVNSAAYGFRNIVEDERQIFSALGSHRAKQLVYAFMINSTSPKEWRYFHLDQNDFKSFQIAMMRDFNTILKSYELQNSPYQSASSIICATVVVADQIFGDHKDDVAIIKQSQDLTLDEILFRISGYSFSNLMGYVAKLWEAEDDAQKLLLLSFGEKHCEGQVCDLAKMMHLLIFKTFSQPLFIKAGLNDFLNLKIEFVEDIYEKFSEVLDETHG